MIQSIDNPEYFWLVHKKSGIKYNTFGVDILKYDDEKFYKYSASEMKELKEESKQQKLIN